MKIPVLFVAAIFSAYGQHIANGSFELFAECPSALGQIASATGWNAPPAAAKPDYFNACSDAAFGVPANFCGNRNAFDGVAYAGITTFSAVAEYREYLQTPINPPLVAGMQYLISFRVANSGSGASNNIGALVSIEQVVGDWTFGPILTIPQINAENVIANYIGWTEISGTYVALGGESHLTIGNFYSDQQTIASGVSAYYYIDDVSITALAMKADHPEPRHLSVYPNPFTDQVWINVFDAEIAKIAVYSPYQIVHEGRCCALVLGALPSGVYCLVATADDGTTFFKKIIKE